MPRLDFQKIAQEREAFEIVLTDGEVIELPKVLNAKKMLGVLNGRSPEQLQNLSQEEGNEFGMKLVEAILGAETWEKILDGIGAENIPTFTTELYKYYNLGGQQDDEEEEGKAAPAALPDAPLPLTTSSTISAPSTPTSNGFIPVAGSDSTTEPSIGESSSSESDISPPSPSS